ncbi:glycosyltransferase family 2 protein [Consotaella sp. CSK11QG-6]
MTPPRVAILLAVYNGERHLDEQLASLAAQTVQSVDVWASDDGSSDVSRAILESWKRRWTKGRFEILPGPRNGFAENFRSLITNNDVESDYFAFCDQDDVWEPDKLAAAIEMLSGAAPCGPALYGARTRLIDEQGRPIGYSPLFSRPPGFGNAIVQNIASGNTMVLNRRAWRILAQSARQTPFVFHDWWSYLIVSGAGGRVVYDPKPHVRYRQHAGNSVGNKMRPLDRLKRFRHALGGRLAAWNDAHLEALDRCSHLLTDDARCIVARMKAIRTSRFADALLRYHRSGIYRQTALEDVTLCIAVLAGRL